MKPAWQVLTSVLAIAVAACGVEQDNTPDAGPASEARTEMASGGMDDPAHDMDGGDVGRSTGVIRSVGDQGDVVVIDHGPIDGVGMDAMSMDFGIMGDVVLSGFTEGDQVAFAVRRGRDDSYRVVAICNTVTDGADCLDGLVDQ